MKRSILRKTLSLLLVLLIPLSSPVFAAGETEESGVPTIVAGGEIITFEPLSDSIRWQNTAQPVFPATVSGTVYGKPAEISVTWQADHAYEVEHPEKGLYVFDAVVGEGCTLAEGVEAPRMTVYIPQTVSGRMARMAGSGTADSPLEITTAHQLAEIAVLVNAGRLESFLLNGIGNVSLKLINDIDLSAYGQSYNGGKGWVPIGIDGKPFKGSFNGGAHTVSGLYIKDSFLDNAGLFGYVSGGNITSLSLSAVNIHAGDWVGAITGYIDEGNIEDCRGSGMVSGGSNIGGVVGWVDTSTAVIKACSFAGMVSGSASWTGGVAGRVSGSLLQHSYSTATVNGSNWVGGVVGMIEDNGTVEYCYATGPVKGSECVGGIAGMNGENCNLQNCAALNSDVEASTSDVGRVAGASYMGTLSGNVAFSGMLVNGSTVTSSDYTDINGADMTAAEIQADGSIATRFTDADGWTIENGKLPGFGAAVDMPVHIRDEGYFIGEGTSESPYEISTPAQLAKLAELVNTGDPNYNSKCYQLTADIDLSGYGSSNTTFNSGKGWRPIGNDPNNFMGKFDGNGKAITGLYIDYTDLFEFAGLFGGIEGGTIENLSVNGSVKGNFGAGVLAGALMKNSEVKNCHTTGNVNAVQYAGGLVGAIYHYDGFSGSTISSCYSTATVTATQSAAGGILGGGALGTIEYCAALNSSVTGLSKVGRIVGDNDRSTLTGNAAFYDMTVMEDDNPKIPTSDGAGSDGEDVTADALQLASGFPYALTAAPWTYEPGSLPGLFGGTVEMPAHITDKLTNFFAGGTGSQSTPYQIATAAQLAKLAELVNAGSSDPSDYSAYSGKYYKLTSDIDLSAYGKSFRSGDGWLPIGHNGNSFYGEFNGNGKTITGLYINNASRDYAGLFGYITTSGNVHDLIIKNAYINAGGSTGIVAGYTSTSVRIEKCFVSGTVKGSGNVGGVAGHVKDSPLAISQCAADVTVSGTANIGGVVGTIDSAVVQNCYATGNVSGTGDNIGGIGGKSTNGSAIKKCYATGSVNSVSTGMYVGGIAGYGQTIENCVALGKSVKGHLGSTCRVTGDKSVSRNNYAFSAMTGSVNSGKTADNVDGADVTIAQANTPEFWTTAGNWNGGAWDNTLWTFTEGKLPILKNLPANLQSGDGGLYLTERDIANATVDAGGPYPYTGSPIEPSLSITFDGATLTKGTDYTVTVTSTDNTDSGTSAGANIGAVTLTITGKGNFKGTIPGISYNIIKKVPTEADLTYALTAKTYNGLTQPLSVTAKTARLGAITVKYDGSTTEPKDAKTYVVTASIAENTNYTAADIILGNHTINKAELTVIGIEAKAYDGTTGADGLALTFQGLQNGEELERGLDYGAAGLSFSSADAGTGKTVTGLVGLNNTSKANNYSLANSLSLTGQTINRAPVSDVTMPVDVARNYATTITLSEQQVSALLNDLTSKDLGSVTCSITSVANDDAVLATTPSIGVINFPLSIYIASVPDAGKTATIRVRVSSKNYADFNVIITVVTNLATYTITASADTNGIISPFGAVAVTKGDSKTFTITANAGYSISSVTVDGVNQGAVGTYTFNNVRDNHVISAAFTGNSGSGGSGGKGGITQPTIPAANGSIQVNYAASNGTATLSLPAAQVNEIIEKNQGGEAVLDLSQVTGVTAASIPKDALTAFSQAGLETTVRLPAGTITLDEGATASVAQQASGSNLTIELQQAATGSLSDAQKEVVKSSDIVLDINITSGTKKISTFEGTLTVSMPYTGPQPVAVWYLNDKGELEKLNCTFRNGVVSFDLDHLSFYVVGQDTAKPAWVNLFTDVKEADWFYAAVSFCSEKGITNGTSATTFSPNATLTRGQFITMLLKAYSIEAVANPTDNFADAGSTYYTGYLAAAKAKGISKGMGDNKFAPEKAITRQEMFTLLYNALKMLNKLPTTDNGKTLADFTDSGSVAVWATEAMTLLANSGMISGSDGKLDPAGGSTRAQMAQVLYKLLGK